MITPILSDVALAATQDPSLAPDAPGAVPPKPPARRAA